MFTDFNWGKQASMIQFNSRLFLHYCTERTYNIMLQFLIGIILTNNFEKKKLLFVLEKIAAKMRRQYWSKEARRRSVKGFQRLYWVVTF